MGFGKIKEISCKPSLEQWNYYKQLNPLFSEQEFNQFTSYKKEIIGIVVKDFKKISPVSYDEFRDMFSEVITADNIESMYVNGKFRDIFQEYLSKEVPSSENGKKNGSYQQTEIQIDSINQVIGNAKEEHIMSNIKVLFLASNPKATKQLALDEEIREITSKIRAAEYRDSIDLTSAWAVKPDDLLQMLNQHKPQIVHFSGHGSQSGEIILISDGGESKPVSSKALKSLFTTLKDNIKVVFLNCCYSEEQAKAITQVIDCVVGMSDAIGDKGAIIFAASFYRAIGFGRSINDAFDQGITALLLEGIPEENTPKLLVKHGVDPSKVIPLG